MALSPLCAICDQDACDRAGWTLPDLASACLEGGATFLQIRAKGRSSGWLLEATREVMRRASGTGALVVVNDRADVARMALAGGVHVGQGDLAPASVRLVAGAGTIVGLSTHTRAQIERAAEAPIDYVAIGPIFATGTKATGYEPLGLDGVRLARGAAPPELPLVAIGGITLDRTAEVIAAGAQSVAVIGDLFSSGNPAARVREYLKRLTV